MSMNPRHRGPTNGVRAPRGGSAADFGPTTGAWTSGRPVGVHVVVLSAMTLVAAACSSGAGAEPESDDASSVASSITPGGNDADVESVAPSTTATSSTPDAAPADDEQRAAGTSEADSVGDIGSSDSVERGSGPAPGADASPDDDVAGERTEPEPPDVSNPQDDLVRQATTSSLYERTVDGEALRDSGRAVEADRGALTNVSDFALHTDLSSDPQYAPLFAPGVDVFGIRADSTVAVHELSDRAVVERTLTFALGLGTCADPNLPPDVGALCVGPDDMSSDELDDVRQMYAAGVGRTGSSESDPSDEELVDLVVNAGPQTVRHVSVVATRPVTLDAPPASISMMGTPLAPGTALPIAPGAEPTPSSRAFPIGGDETEYVDEGTDYFLTGFTIGRRLGDSYGYESCWGYCGFSLEWEVGYGFGLRAPFSVDVGHDSLGASKRRAYVSAAPVDVSNDGMPAFPAVGLDESKYFDGHEFVLEAEVSCSIAAWIWEARQEWSCPEVGHSESRDIPPVIGDETSDIGELWIPPETTGLSFSWWQFDVGVDVGVAADVANGRYLVDVSPMLRSSVDSGDELVFATRDPILFAVEGDERLRAGGFVLGNPRSEFDVRIIPAARLRARAFGRQIVDETFEFTPAAIALPLSLGPHDGTVTERSYDLFDLDFPVASSSGAEPSTSP